MKKIILLLLVCTLVVTLTGCGNKKERVVIYSVLEEERNQELKKQLAEQFPDYDITVQFIATGNLAAKIENEKSNIEADIILALETAHLVNLTDNFATLSGFNTDAYLDGVITSDKYYTWEKYTMNLIVDNKYFKEHNLKVPKTYEDLLKKQYKNLIAMPDPKTSGTGYAFLLNAINVMGEDEAFAYYEDLKPNIREFSTSGAGPTNLLKQGEVAIALGMTAQGVNAINEGYDFSIVELDTGSPYNSTGSAIIKGRENNSAVREVFQWLISDFIRYDKENFMPDIILKDQNNKIENYPTNLKDADMTGIYDNKLKERITNKWGEING